MVFLMRPYPSSKSVTTSPARYAAALVLVSLCVALAGCGETFRPIAIPTLQPGGDPQNTRIATVVNNNNGGPGSTTTVDATGDTNIGNFQVGNDPVHAAYWFGGTTRVYVANRGSDSLSYYAPLQLGSAVAVVTLPTGSRPVYVSSIASTFVYAAESGTNNVAIVDAGLGVLSKEVPVGLNPVAIAQTPDGAWAYVANKGSGTVSIINTSSQALDSTLVVGASPVWVTAKSDSSTVYVLNQGSGTVTVIDAVNKIVVGTVSVGPSPSTMVFDKVNHRLYVANTGSNTVSVLNADPQVPVMLATVTVGAGPTSIAPLPDSSRFYVANAGCADPVNMTGCSGSTVSVVDALSFTVRKTLTVGNTPISLVASPESTKVVVANRDSNNINDIRTLDDTVVSTINSASPRPVFVAINTQ
jgi:YVTN family beta-propeller protein